MRAPLSDFLLGVGAALPCHRMGYVSAAPDFITADYGNSAEMWRKWGPFHVSTSTLHAGLSHPQAKVLGGGGLCWPFLWSCCPFGSAADCVLCQPAGAWPQPPVVCLDAAQHCGDHLQHFQRPRHGVCAAGMHALLEMHALFRGLWKPWLLCFCCLLCW